MELEEMKALWDTMSEKVEKQQIVTDQLIMEMTQQKYKNKFSKLLMYERLGAVVCIVAGLLLLFNIQKLDTWYLMACGIFTIGFLLVLPFVSLGAIRGMTKLKVSKYNFKETVVRFEKAKNKTLFIQRVSIVLSLILMFTSLPVFSKIFNDKDFFLQEHGIGFWIFVTAVGIGVLFFTRWAYGCYNRITSSAERILKEMDE